MPPYSSRCLAAKYRFRFAHHLSVFVSKVFGLSYRRDDSSFSLVLFICVVETLMILVLKEYFSLRSAKFFLCV